MFFRAAGYTETYPKMLYRGYGPASFGRWVKQHRKALDLTQPDLAGMAGCPSSQSSRSRPASAGLPGSWPSSSCGPCRPRLATSLPPPARQGRVGADSLPGQDSDQAPPNNLPAQLTRFFGREKSLGDLRRLLSDDDVRLLTLTGPPGVGKTRLGLQLAGHLLERSEHGVYFVALAALRDPNLVPNSILQTLGTKDDAGLSLFDRLVRNLQNRRVLLVLDNFEQIVPRGLWWSGCCRSASLEGAGYQP